MTPKQFHLLWGRHREDIMHREMVQAFTTAAIINHSLCRPEEPVQPKDFMPNFAPPVRKQEGPPIPPEVRGAFEAKRAKISRLLKQYKATGKADPYLIKIGLVANG
jgi:hypothetical protein